MSKPIVREIGNCKGMWLCLSGNLSDGELTRWLSKQEALQLAKDLLDACGAEYDITVKVCDGSIDDARIYDHALSEEQVKELYVSSGMSLDEIQMQAKRADGLTKNVEISTLALLIANLAARMKEVSESQLGAKLVCTCGQVHRYVKMVK